MLGEIKVIEKNEYYDKNKWLECDGSIYTDNDGKFNNLIENKYGSYSKENLSYKSPTIDEILIKQYSKNKVDINRHVIHTFMCHKHEMDTPYNDDLNEKLYYYNKNENISDMLYKFICKRNEIKILIKYNI